ncbi:MAG: acetylxylan esterase [Planctomycetales bacterium]|nr:acetylxylan esterase [Planctomycetales bacterium]
MRNRPLPTAWLLAMAALGFQGTYGQEPDHRVYAPGQQPPDARLAELKDLNGYFPFEVPETREAWETRREALRRQVLVATGLWPLPERTPLNPVIYGRVAREGFTVERVYFESIPNHFVTGLLFRPAEDSSTAGDKQHPAVLCPHGHGGRMQDHGVRNMASLIERGDEKYEASGRFPKLARCAQLARMGCVVFIFDMLGYADSVQISRELAHGFAKQRPDFEGSESWGLFSAQAEQRLQSVMGIQTWNSIRCLDFLQQLPDVDPQRIGVTGGSGGGTQTILLCAIDERPVVGFPNGMVSTSMQGGCTCENCSLLRIGTGNVELAALFAPKPQAMTAANDWTKEMMTKGYPQLQQLYALLGAKENVYCRPLLHFPHNYNYVSRETMYQWFNRHLGLNLDDVVERDYELLSAEETTVWNEQHPQPAGGESYERELTKYLAEVSDRQIAALTPKDIPSWNQYRHIIGGAVQTLVGRSLPSGQDIEREMVEKLPLENYFYFEDKLRLPALGEELPVVSFYPTAVAWTGKVVIWIHGRGKAGLFTAGGQPRAEVQQLLDAGTSVVAADLFQQGEFLTGEEPLQQQRSVKNPREAAAFTYGYNAPLFVRRVHDVLTLISFVRSDDHAPQQLALLGTDGAAPLAATARYVAGGQVDKLAVDTQGFRFADITSIRDVNLLPGMVKYGDLPAILALNAPHPLWIGGEAGQLPPVVQAAYSANDSLPEVHSAPRPVLAEAVEWLLHD